MKRMFYGFFFVNKESEPEAAQSKETLLIWQVTNIWDELGGLSPHSFCKMLNLFILVERAHTMFPNSIWERT